MTPVQCTKYFPVLLCTTTKLAQSLAQYYFALQSSQKGLPSTTLYYRACTKHVPVLLCTTKLAKRMSLYCLVLQSLRKAWPSTTLYYNARKKDFPVQPCTRKLAQSTSQYYFVLQSLQEECPCTTLYYKACTKHVPVLLCTCMQQSCSHYNTFCSMTWLTRISLRTCRQNYCYVMSYVMYCSVM